MRFSEGPSFPPGVKNFIFISFTQKGVIEVGDQDRLGAGADPGGGQVGRPPQKPFGHPQNNLATWAKPHNIMYRY